MNKFLIVFLFALVASNVDVDTIMFQQFQKFIKKYNKKYASINEYLARFEVFKRNVMAAFTENTSYQTGITKFSDLTQQEFAKTYLNLNYDAMAVANFNPYIVTVKNAAPEAWDWRDKGYVSPVKDQGSCGSCWAFSTIANLEGLYYKEKGVMVTMSEQMLVDCDTIDSGCNGGLMENTFTWLKQNGGIMNDEDYPYKGYKSSCKNPLQTYSSGILDKTSSQCPTSGMNHAVTMVGYGHDDALDKDYWIIKNSWGENWGEDGYFRIRRGTGCCGINCYITTAKVSF